MGDESGTTLSTAEEGRVAARSRAYLFCVLNAERPLDASSRHLLDGLSEVSVGRGTAGDTSRRAGRLALRLPDRWMSSQHARLFRDSKRWMIEDCGSKNGLLVNGVVTRTT